MGGPQDYDPRSIVDLLEMATLVIGGGEKLIQKNGLMNKLDLKLQGVWKPKLAILLTASWQIRKSVWQPAVSYFYRNQFQETFQSNILFERVQIN